MSHDFDKEEIARWFIFNYTCWYCGRNHANCFHHIQGRSGDAADSILNAAPLSNFDCHLPVHGKIRTRWYRIQFLEKTLSYLLSQGYEFNEKDRRFIEKHFSEYQDIARRGMHIEYQLSPSPDGSKPPASLGGAPPVEQGMG